MAVRIFSACVALPLFFLIIYVLPPMCFPVFVAALSVIAVYELLWRSNIVRSAVMTGVAYVYAAAIPFAAFLCFDDMHLYVYPFVFVFIAIAFIHWLFNQHGFSFKDLSAVFFAAIVLPMFLSALVRIFYMDNGKLLILIPFIAAWVTDTGAYFTGVFFGKHKLAPSISPKKTVEGSLGGILCAVIALIVFGRIIGITSTAVPQLALCGLLLSAVAQIGDLSMSLIKREYNIKDYGIIFPGHGGILDRFDSVLFTAPASLILLELFRNSFIFSAL